MPSPHCPSYVYVGKLMKRGCTACRSSVVRVVHGWITSTWEEKVSREGRKGRIGRKGRRRRWRAKADGARLARGRRGAED